MSTNGRTATDFSGIVGAAGVVAGDDVATSCSTAVTCFESQNLSISRYATASTRTTTMARFRRCAVCALIDRCGSTSAVGLRPSGVISYTHANRRTAGKPTAISITTSLLAHTGTSSM